MNAIPSIGPLEGMNYLGRQSFETSVKDGASRARSAMIRACERRGDDIEAATTVVPGAQSYRTVWKLVRPPFRREGSFRHVARLALRSRHFPCRQTSVVLHRFAHARVSAQLVRADRLTGLRAVDVASHNVRRILPYLLQPALWVLEDFRFFHAGKAIDHLLGHRLPRASYLGQHRGTSERVDGVLRRHRFRGRGRGRFRS
jgi:hypothetical protein